MTGSGMRAKTPEAPKRRGGHNIHFDQPEAAVGAIMRMVKQVRQPASK
jgi:hypothetical protein